jgi:hypothetical protein
MTQIFSHGDFRWPDADEPGTLYRYERLTGRIDPRRLFLIVPEFHWEFQLAEKVGVG